MHNLPTNNETNLIRDIFARTAQVNKQLQEGKDTRSDYEKTKEGVAKSVTPAVTSTLNAIGTGVSKAAGAVVGAGKGVLQGAKKVADQTGATDAFNDWSRSDFINPVADTMAPQAQAELERELDTPERRNIEARQAAAVSNPEYEKRRLLDPRNKPTPQLKDTVQIPPMTEAVVLAPQTPNANLRLGNPPQIPKPGSFRVQNMMNAALNPQGIVPAEQPMDTAVNSFKAGERIQGTINSALYPSVDAPLPTGGPSTRTPIAPGSSKQVMSASTQSAVDNVMKTIQGIVNPPSAVPGLPEQPMDRAIALQKGVNDEKQRLETTIDAQKQRLANVNQTADQKVAQLQAQAAASKKAADEASPEASAMQRMINRNAGRPENETLPAGMKDRLINEPVTGGMSSEPITDFSPGAQAARVAARDRTLGPNATPYQRADVAARELEANRRAQEAAQRKQDDTARLDNLSSGYSKLSQTMGGKPVTWENSDETIRQADSYLNYKGIDSANATPEQLQRAVQVGKERAAKEEAAKAQRANIARRNGFDPDTGKWTVERNPDTGEVTRDRFQELQDKRKAERDANQERWENSPNNPKNKKTGPQPVPESYYRRLANLFEETREPSGPQVNQAAYGFDPRGGRNARKAEASLRSGMWRGDSTTKGSTRNPKKERNVGKRELSGEDIKQAVTTLYSAAMEHPEFRRMSEIGEFGKAHIMSPSSSAHRALLAKYPEGHEVHQASAKILKYGNR